MTYSALVSANNSSFPPPREPAANPSAQPDPNTLALEFSQLDLAPRVVMEIAALLGAPFSFRLLIEIGRKLPWQAEEFTPSRLGPILDRLVAAGLLIETEDLQCPPAVADHIAVEAMQAERTAAISERLRQLDSWKGGMHRDPEAIKRHFRYYLYAQEFRHAGGLATNYETIGCGRMWGEVGRQFLSYQSFLRFPDDIALLLARDTLVQSLNQAFPAPHALVAFRHLLATDKDKQLCAHVLMMRRASEDFEAFLDDYDSPTLAGCQKILEGDLGGLDDLERGLAESGSFFSYTALFLYLVALLSKEGFESRRARQVISKSATFRVPMEWLLRVKGGQISEITPEMRMLLREPPQALIPHLALILYWAGFRYQGLNAEALATSYARAGYPVFAEWLFWSSGSALPTAAPPPFLRLLEPEEQWRKVLASIQEWTAPARGASAAAAQRLAWYVDLAGPTPKVYPRIQKLSKRGVWSSGKQADLGELWERPPHRLDDCDQKVLDAMNRRERSQRRYGYFQNQDLVSAALLALIGHPRVYLFSAPEEAIELVEEPVSVQILRFPSHLEVQLEPAAVREPAVLAVGGESGGRVRLFNMTDRHVQLGRMLEAGLKIPLEGETELQEVLAGLASAGLVLRSDIPLAGDAPEVEPDETLIVRLAPYLDGLSVQVRVAPLGPAGPLLVPGEGSPVVAARVNGGSLQTNRDLESEHRCFAQLRELHDGFVSCDFSLSSPLDSLRFMERLSPLEDPRLRLEWPEGQRFQVARILPASSLGQNVRSSSGGDWFSVGAEVKVDEGLVWTLGELLERRRQAGSRFLPLSEGRFLALTEELEHYLERLERVAHRQRGGKLLLHPLAALSALEAQEMEVDSGWVELKERFEMSQGLEPIMPRTLHGELRGYQTDGVRWLMRLAHWGVGACLADDMGLGKTVQLLTLLLDRAHRGPALVVAPTSVCWNWVEEARRFAPSLRVISLADSARDAVWQELGGGDVLVCSYGLLVNEAEPLAAVLWATVILDEAQAVKNPSTRRAQAAWNLQAEFRIAATGTPVENHPEEMWALFRYLNPGLLGSRKGFQKRFAGSPEAQQELARLVKPFILRRTKDQVLKELPPRTEMVEKIQLSTGERALYESLRREAVDRLQEPSEDYLSVLAQLTKLRRACCHPRLVVPEAALGSSKLERCHELVEELIENGHRALVFSQFVSFLKIFRDELEARGTSYAYLDGSTPPTARRKAVQSFQSGQGELFLISLKAGGTGLNLTGADYVIHLDPWWNPAVEDQASDRAHRMGQLRPVTVYRLVTQGTIEEQILELHGRKRSLADRLLEGTEGSDRLSAADLLELLRP